MSVAWLRGGFVAAAAIILSWQLFFPPIVGQADQGDFTRMIGRFGYGAVDKSAEYAFLARKYVPDPNARLRVYEQVSSEYIFVGAAVLFNRVFSRDGSLDITIIGLVHMLAFLYAFYRLLLATGPLRAAPLIWILALLALTDVGYVAYWNSFYAEPASCIFFLLLLAESIAICRTQDVSNAQAIRWTLWAVLFVHGEAAECSARSPAGAVRVPAPCLDQIGSRGQHCDRKLARDLSGRRVHHHNQSGGRTCGRALTIKSSWRSSRNRRLRRRTHRLWA